MNTSLRRVGVLSAAKVGGVFYGILGLIFIPIFVLLALVGAVAEKTQDARAALVGAIFVAIFMPVLYAVIGFAFGALAAFLYNAIAGWFGGLELELDGLVLQPVPPLVYTPPAPAAPPPPPNQPLPEPPLT